MKINKDEYGNVQIASDDNTKQVQIGPGIGILIIIGVILLLCWLVSVVT